MCRCRCVQNQYLWFAKFPIFRNIWIYPNRFYVFLKCGILWNLFRIPQRKVSFILCRLFIKKLLRQILWYITNSSKKKLARTGNHCLFLGLFTVNFWRSWPIWRHAYECACVCHRRVFSSQLFTPWPPLPLNSYRARGGGGKNGGRTSVTLSFMLIQVSTSNLRRHYQPHAGPWS